MGALLQRERLLTLIGPGGIGKSRLSLQVAEAAAPARADGVWQVELAALSDPATVGHALATLTDDVVDLPPNSPALVGKAAIDPWLRGDLAAWRTVWEKTSVEFVVNNDWAYERYTCKSVDTPRADGPAAGTSVVADTGQGFNIYRHGSDGRWCVARDSWATDRPAATE